MVNSAAAVVYWVIVLIWFTIFLTLGLFYQANRRTFGTTRLLLAVLALDALRNIFENTYFGLYFGSRFGLFAPGVALVLGRPDLLIVPKLTNVAAGCIVLSLLLLKWLPQSIGERAAAEQQAADLHQLATIDFMTGLLNRRAFMQQAEAEWSRFQRHPHALALVVFDIDDLKSINDRFGHGSGDDVIVLIAKLCRMARRVSDVAGRMGGDEFAILLPETSAAEAGIFADRLRTMLAAHPAMLPNGERVTVSLGISAAGASATLSDMFNQADLALYEAKRSGRNRACHFAATP